MAKRQKTDNTQQVDQIDLLAGDILDSINKRFKDLPDKAAHFLFGDGQVISDVTDWVHTGSSMLDLAISNRPNGGFPVGRITEIMGESASGKSLLAAHALAATQRKGGLAVLFDTEAAVSQDYLQAIGVDTTKLLYVNLECLEDIFESIEKIIESVRKSNRDKIVTIVVDSVMGATTKIELEADYNKDGWATSKAIILSKAMRKITNMIAREKICLIFTNQVRTNLAVTFGEKDITSGGKALGFHSSVRIKLKSAGQLKGDINGLATTIGIRTIATVKKNRLGPPLRSISYDIYFDSGIDDYGSWLTMLKDMGVISQSGAYYTYDLIDESTGELTSHKFKSKDFKRLLIQTPNLQDAMYRKICENFIMTYKMSDNLGIDDVTLETDVNYEDE